MDLFLDSSFNIPNLVSFDQNFDSPSQKENILFINEASKINF